MKFILSLLLLMPSTAFAARAVMEGICTSANTLLVNTANTRVSIGGTGACGTPASTLHVFTPTGNGIRISTASTTGTATDFSITQAQGGGQIGAWNGGTVGPQMFFNTYGGIDVNSGNFGVNLANGVAPISTFHADHTKNNTLSYANAAAAIGDYNYGEVLSIQAPLSAPYGIVMNVTDGSNGTTNSGPLLLMSMGGNVGIGMLNPTYLLDVNGGARISSTTQMGWEIISNNCTTALSCTATCSAGKVVLGGGCKKDTSNTNISTSYPASSTTWTCTINTGDTNFTAYAICARMGTQ